jgi:hypothetical protein
MPAYIKLLGRGFWPSFDRMTIDIDVGLLCIFIYFYYCRIPMNDLCAFTIGEHATFRP